MTRHNLDHFVCCGFPIVVDRSNVSAPDGIYLRRWRAHAANTSTTIGAPPVRRNEARERALDDVLIRFREKCHTIAASHRDANLRASEYKRARRAAMDEIYAIMRPTWKPAP